MVFDAVRGAGGSPANYCEIGGNPSVTKASALTRLVLSKPGVKKIAVMMNVVSNTRADMMARGVIKGCIEAGRVPADTTQTPTGMVVAAFLAGRIPWIAIAEVLKAVMDRHDGAEATTVADVVEADAAARRCAASVLDERN